MSKNSAIRSRNEGAPFSGPDAEKFKIPFPIAGEGFYIRATITAICELEKEHKSADGFWFASLENRLAELHPGTLADAAEMMIFTPEGELAFPNADAIDFPIREIAQPALDAICLQVWGKPHRVIVADLEASFADEAG